MIELTESAAERVRQFLAARNDAAGLRLGVRKSGCSGFAYVMDLADAVGDDDQVFDCHGVKVIIDARSLPMLDGIRLDFVRDGLSESFRFENPNVKSECGCGESFGV